MLFFVLFSLCSLSLAHLILPCPPVQRPQFCPAAVLDECDTNADCTGGRQCCPTGCFRKCTGSIVAPQPVTVQNKPGRCPATRPQFACPMVIRDSDCKGDSSCPGDMKCCRVGCSSVCLAVPVLANKPGVCPANPPGMACSLIGNPNACRDDTACPDSQKCCHTGCSSACVDALPPKPKPGKCPANTLPEGLACPLMVDPNACRGDEACPGAQKCCSTGCTRSCVAAEIIAPVTKPGLCPEIQARGIRCAQRFDPNVCRNDSVCPGAQKCCRTACSRKCVNVGVARAENDDFIAEEFVGDADGSMANVGPTSEIAQGTSGSNNDSVPAWGIVVFVLLGILLVGLIVIQVQLFKVLKN